MLIHPNISRHIPHTVVNTFPKGVDEENLFNSGELSQRVAVPSSPPRAQGETEAIELLRQPDTNLIAGRGWYGYR